MSLRAIWTSATVEYFPDATCRGGDEIAAYFGATMAVLHPQPLTQETWKTRQNEYIEIITRWANRARQLGVDEHAVIKTLVMQDQDAKPLIVLMHGDRQVSTKNLARQIGAKAVERRQHSGIETVNDVSPDAKKKVRYFTKQILDNLDQAQKDHPDQILRAIGYFKNPELLANMADADKTGRGGSVTLGDMIQEKLARRGRRDGGTED